MKHEKFIFQSCKANLKNFLSLKYEEIYELIDKKVDENKIKVKGQNNKIIVDSDSENKSEKCLNKKQKKISLENSFEDFSISSFDNTSSGSDSSFDVKSNIHNKKLLISDYSTKDSIGAKDTTIESTPRKNCDFSNDYFDDYKYIICEENENGNFSDCYKSCFVTVRDFNKIYSDDEIIKKQNKLSNEINKRFITPKKKNFDKSKNNGKVYKNEKQKNFISELNIDLNKLKSETENLDNNFNNGNRNNFQNENFSQDNFTEPFLLNYSNNLEKNKKQISFNSENLEDGKIQTNKNNPNKPNKIKKNYKNNLKMSNYFNIDLNYLLKVDNLKLNENNLRRIKVVNKNIDKSNLNKNIYKNKSISKYPDFKAIIKEETLKRKQNKHQKKKIKNIYSKKEQNFDNKIKDKFENISNPFLNIIGKETIEIRKNLYDYDEYPDFSNNLYNISECIEENNKNNSDDIFMFYENKDKILTDSNKKNEQANSEFLNLQNQKNKNSKRQKIDNNNNYNNIKNSNNYISVNNIKNYLNSKSSSNLNKDYTNKTVLNNKNDDNISLANSNNSNSVIYFNREINKFQKNKKKITQLSNNNHKIQDYFQVNPVNKEKEEEILKSILKIYINEKYSKFLNLVENSNEFISNLSTVIYQNSNRIILGFNSISEEILNSEKDKIKQERILSENSFFLPNGIFLDFELEFESAIVLIFQFYRENLVNYLNFFYYDSDDEFNTPKFSYFIENNGEAEIKTYVDNILIAENIIKIIIKNINIFTWENANQEESTKDKNLIFLSFILPEVKELFIFYAKKVFLDNNIFKENFYNNKYSDIEYSDLNIFTELLIDRLGIFIIFLENLYNHSLNHNIKLSENPNNNNSKTYSHKLNNILVNFKNLFSQFLLILSYFILIKIYSLDFSEINLKKFNKSKLNQSFQYMSLFIIVSENYNKIKKSTNSSKIFSPNENIEVLLDINKLIFDEFLTEGLLNNPNPNFEFDQNFLVNISNNKNKQNFENTSHIFKYNLKNNFYFMVKDIFFENVVNKQILHKNFKCCLYKIFICLTNNIYDSNLISGDVRNFIHNDIFLHIYKRYFNLILISLYFSNLKFIKFSVFDDIFEKNIFIQSTKNSDLKITQKNIFSYYDLENITNNINNLELKRKINFTKKCKLLNEYLLSDIKTIILLDKYWKLDPDTLIKYIFSFFNILNSQHRRNLMVDDQLNNKNLYKLIDMIFDHGNIKENTNEEKQDINYFSQECFFPPLIEFIFKCNRLIRKLLHLCKEEKHKKILLNKFHSNVSKYLISEKNYSENSLEFIQPKLGTIPRISIAVCYVEFAYVFMNNSDIELTVEKIRDILDFEKSSAFMKGFNISIFIKIILNFSRKNINLTKLIGNLNNQIKNLNLQIIQYENYKKNKILENHNLNENNNDNLKTEIFPTLHFVLNNLLNISKERPKIFIENPIILEELKNLLEIKFKLALNYKQIIINILTNCVEQFEDYLNDTKISEIKNNRILIEEDGITFEIDDTLFECNQVDNNMNINNSFLIKLRDDFLYIFHCLIQNSIKENRVNKCGSNQTLSFPFLKSVADILSKTSGLLCKYQLLKINIFNEKFETELSFFSYSFRKIFSNNPKYSDSTNISNGELLDNITQVPFRTYNNFIHSYPKFLLREVLEKRDYKILGSFIKLFFSGIMYNNSCKNFIQKYEIFNQKNNSGCNYFLGISSNNKNDEKNEMEKYIFTFINLIKSEIFSINNLINKIKKEIEINPHLENLKEEESAFYKILLFFSEEKIFNLLSASNSSSKRISQIFEVLFDDYFSTKTNIYKIQSNILVGFLKDIDEIIFRGISLENVKQNKNLLSNSYQSDNYCFDVMNFYFRLLLRKFPKDFQGNNKNGIVILFKNFMDDLLKDSNFKDLSNFKISISLNLFEFCCYIINYKEKTHLNKLNEDLEFNNKSLLMYLNFLAFRIKNFLEFLFETEYNTINANIRDLNLNFSKGFYFDSYFIQEKKKRKIYKEKIFSSLALDIERNYSSYFNEIENARNNKINQLKNKFKLSEEIEEIKMDIDSVNLIFQDKNNFDNSKIKKENFEDFKKEIIINEKINNIFDCKNSNKTNDPEFDENILFDEINDIFLKEEEEKQNNISNSLKTNPTFSSPSSNDKIKINKIPLPQNLTINNFCKNSQKNYSLLIDDEHTGCIDLNLQKVINKFTDSDFNFLNTYSEKKNKYINNLVNILRFISSKDYIQDNLFQSKNYFFFILFIINKIFKNFQNKDIYLNNFQLLFININFTKYQILKIEDFYFNFYILQYLDFSMNLNTLQKYNNQKPENELKNIIFFNFSKNFLNKVLEYVLEIMRFINKYFILQYGNNKNILITCIMETKFKTIENFIDNCLKKLFMKNLFYEPFSNKEDILITESNLQDEKKFISKFFFDKGINIYRESLLSIKNIIDSVKNVNYDNIIKVQNTISIDENLSFSTLDYKKTIDFVEFFLSTYEKLFNLLDKDNRKKNILKNPDNLNGEDNPNKYLNKIKNNLQLFNSDII